MSLSPELLYSATLGDGVEPRTSLVIGPNPEGVASCRIDLHSGATFVVDSSLEHQGHNPVGVGKQRDPASQGSRVQQPWALSRNPFGVVPPTPVGGIWIGLSTQSLKLRILAGQITVVTISRMLR